MIVYNKPSSAYIKTTTKKTVTKTKQKNTTLEQARTSTFHSIEDKINIYNNVLVFLRSS